MGFRDRLRSLFYLLVAIHVVADLVFLVFWVGYWIVTGRRWLGTC
jgi:hypothetical protein